MRIFSKDKCFITGNAIETIIWNVPTIVFNTLRPRQNGHYFADDHFKCIFLNVYTWISVNISLMFVPKDQINNIPTLVQIMAWCWLGNKSLSEPMMVKLLMHFCITQPQWIKKVTVKLQVNKFWHWQSDAIITTFQILVNICSDNGLLPHGTKPLHEPMLIYHYQGSFCVCAQPMREDVTL